jgi:hypothetical protein
MPDKRLNTPVRRIERDAAGVRVSTDQGTEHFDHVVLATHSDQALALLAQPTAQERAVLGAIRYQPNRAVLHTDTTVLPAAPRRLGRLELRARPADRPRERPACACTTCSTSCSPCRLPSPWWCRSTRCATSTRADHWQYEYAHPVFDLGAIAAQQQVPATARPAAHLVLRRLDGLRLPRRRAQVRPGRGAPTGAAAASAPKAGRMTTEPRATHQGRAPAGLWPGAPHPAAAAQARVCLRTFFLMLPMRTLAQGGGTARWQ